jgi:CHAT domain-containing protein
VHIASHFSFRPGDEARSFLLMGDGTAFTLDEIKKHTDMFAGVDLLTLSACNTAAQQADANGREVDAFFELAQRLGANSVLATLWSVADNSTPWLMREFYDLKVNGKQNKAEALRKAQLALLNGSARTARSATRTDSSNVKIVVVENADDKAQTRADDFVIEKKDAPLFKNDLKRPFAHPFYWSPFVLIGNWR